MKVLLIISLLIITSCSTLEDVRNRQPFIHKTVRGNYKTLASCFEDDLVTKSGSVSAYRRLENNKRASVIGYVDTFIGWEAQFINLGKNSTEIVVYPEVSLGKDYTHRAIKESLDACL